MDGPLDSSFLALLTVLSSFNPMVIKVINKYEKLEKNAVSFMDGPLSKNFLYLEALKVTKPH